MIRHLRDFLGKGGSRYISLDLNELVHEIMPLVRREIEEQSVQVELDLAPGLPRLSGDRVELQQVIVNLIKNACEAMAGAPHPRRLVIRSARAGAAVELSVADTGPGVPPGLAATVFEPFVTAKSGGMGMGLAISRSLVERHGGTLD